MPNVLTRTFAKTFTRPRLAVVQDQFDLMLRYASVGGSRRSAILKRISDKKIEGIGLYIEEGGFMCAEVSLNIDWARHDKFISVVGDVFEIDRPGWENGVCPEVSVAANRIANAAKEMGVALRMWVRFTDDVRGNSSEHESLCGELGFEYKSCVPGWRKGCATMDRGCPDLPELSVLLKEAKHYWNGGNETFFEEGSEPDTGSSTS